MKGKKRVFYPKLEKATNLSCLSCAVEPSCWAAQPLEPSLSTQNPKTTPFYVVVSLDMAHPRASPVAEPSHRGSPISGEALPSQLTSSHPRRVWMWFPFEIFDFENPWVFDSDVQEPSSITVLWFSSNPWFTLGLRSPPPAMAALFSVTPTPSLAWLILSPPESLLNFSLARPASIAVWASILDFLQQSSPIVGQGYHLLLLPCSSRIKSQNSTQFLGLGTLCFYFGPVWTWSCWPTHNCFLLSCNFVKY